jgi:hypothetical protein
MARLDLDDLVRQLAALYGDDLVAVVLYGSAAAGQHIPKRSDTNVLVLVKELDLARLQSESAIARAWAAAGNPAPLTLTIDEWRGSADVFPMEYADILDRHRVLHGTPPFDGIRVQREHLRLQVEHQALGKLLQLRQGVLAAGTDAGRLLELLASSLSTFMTIFRAVLRLAGERPPAEYADLTAEVARRVGLDADPFLRVIRHARGEARISRSDVSAVLGGYLEGVRRLVHYVDRLPPSRPIVDAPSPSPTNEEDRS